MKRFLAIRTRRPDASTGTWRSRRWTGAASRWTIGNGSPISLCQGGLDGAKFSECIGVSKRQKVNELFPHIDPKSVVLVDDNDDTLGMYTLETPFCTAHPFIFIENQE